MPYPVPVRWTALTKSINNSRFKLYNWRKPSDLRTFFDKTRLHYHSVDLSVEASHECIFSCSPRQHRSNFSLIFISKHHLPPLKHFLLKRVTGNVGYYNTLRWLIFQSFTDPNSLLIYYPSGSSFLLFNIKPLVLFHCNNIVTVSASYIRKSLFRICTDYQCAWLTPLLLKRHHLRRNWSRKAPKRRAKLLMA